MRRRLISLARRLGYDVVASDHYSPVLDPDTLPAHAFEQAEAMPGLELDLDAQLAFVEQELLPLAAQLAVPLKGAGLHLDNGWYGPLDAHVLYALLRRRPPRRVVELGSGYSTLFIERALDDAGATGREHHVIDPYPSPLLGTVRERLRVMPVSGARAPQTLFDALEADDVLFIDSSHVVKPGGEVIRVVLESLAGLAQGVLVHFHDIYRPFAYPRVFSETFNVHWQEQYLLQAFLAFNPHFEVVCANHALWRLRRERVRGLFPALRDGMEPSGFWFRRS